MSILWSTRFGDAEVADELVDFGVGLFEADAGLTSVTAKLVP